MKAKIFLIYVLFSVLFVNSIFAQRKLTPDLSDNAEISITTCSPGIYLYSVFGHTTIHIRDSANKIDYIYHYGTFNYEEENFYWKFIRGTMNYMLAVQTYDGFLWEYSRDKRDVWELKLNLDKETKQKIFDYLVWKSLPQNKYYHYDFFYDNCATRVRDVFVKFLGDSLILPERQLDISFRDAINPMLKGRPWIKLGINIGLGLPADKKLNLYTACFLPDYLDTAFRLAKVNINGKIQPFVLSRKKIIDSGYKPPKTPFYAPVYVFSLLFVLIVLISLYELKKDRFYRWIDFSWLFISGLAGVIILFLWFGTLHSATKNNLNIFWALPTNLIVAFFVFFKKTYKLADYYNRFLFVLYTLFFFGSFFLPQKFDAGLYPLLMIMIFRSGLFIARSYRGFKFY